MTNPPYWTSHPNKFCSTQHHCLARLNHIRASRSVYSRNGCWSQGRYRLSLSPSRYRCCKHFVLGEEKLLCHIMCCDCLLTSQVSRKLDCRGGYQNSSGTSVKKDGQWRSATGHRSLTTSGASGLFLVNAGKQCKVPCFYESSPPQSMVYPGSFLVTKWLELTSDLKRTL